MHLPRPIFLHVLTLCLTCSGLLNRYPVAAQDRFRPLDTLAVHPKAPSSAGDDLAYKHFELANGLDVVLVPESRAATAGIALYVRAGWGDESTFEWGAQNYLAHQLRNMVALEERAAGVRLRMALEESRFTVRTDWDGVGVSMQQPAGHTAYGVWLMGQLLGRTLFHLDTQAVAPWQKRMAVGRTPRLLSSAFPEDHPYHQPSGRQLPPEQAYRHLQAYTGRCWSPDRGVLVVTGAFEEDQVLEEIHRYMATIPASGSTPVAYHPASRGQPQVARVRRIRYQTDEEHAALFHAWPMPAGGADPTEARRALSALLDDPRQAPLDERFRKNLGLDSLRVRYQKGRFGDLMWYEAYGPDSLDWERTANRIQKDLRLLRRGLLDMKLGRRQQDVVRAAYGRDYQSMSHRAETLGRYFVHGHGIDHTLARYQALSRVSPRLLDNAYADGIARSGGTQLPLGAAAHPDSAHALTAVAVDERSQAARLPAYTYSPLFPSRAPAAPRIGSLPPPTKERHPQRDSLLVALKQPYTDYLRIMVHFPIKASEDSDQPLGQGAELMKPALYAHLARRVDRMRAQAGVRAALLPHPEGLRMRIEAADASVLGALAEMLQQPTEGPEEQPPLPVESLVNDNGEEVQLNEMMEGSDMEARASRLAHISPTWSLHEAITGSALDPDRSGLWQSVLPLAPYVLETLSPYQAILGGMTSSPKDYLRGLSGSESPTTERNQPGIPGADEQVFQLLGRGGSLTGRLADEPEPQDELQQGSWLFVQETRAPCEALEGAMPLPGIDQEKSFVALDAAVRHLKAWMEVHAPQWLWSWQPGRQESLLMIRYAEPLPQDAGAPLRELQTLLRLWKEEAQEAQSLTMMRQTQRVRRYHRLESVDAIMDDAWLRHTLPGSWPDVQEDELSALEISGWVNQLTRLAQIDRAAWLLRAPSQPRTVPATLDVRVY